MNGIILIDKEKNMTSRDVVNITSKALKTKKVGHTGTLDPLATGVMVICVGKYTKLVEILTSYDKTYEAEILLGIKTDSLDNEGVVLNEAKAIVETREILDVLNNFEKEYMQEVPIYSAVRIDGKKLYEYARNNEEVELPKRLVKINSLELISDVEHIGDKTKFKIRCNVSKGTYIRSLVNDIALKLNTIGIMNNLRRIKQGDFDIADCYKIEDIKNNNFKFIDEDIIFKNYNVIEIDDFLYKKISAGALINNYYDTNKVVFKYKNDYIAIYEIYEKDKNKMKPWKML